MDKNEIRKMIREEIRTYIPELFGKTMVQLRAFFLSNIT